MKVKATGGTMVIKAYPVIERAVEEGIAYGITRVFKHLDSETLSEEGLRLRASELETAVINAICEVADFGDIE